MSTEERFNAEPSLPSQVSHRRLAVLGATGSIGRLVLDLVRRFPTLFDVVAITANRDVEGIREWLYHVQSPYIAMADPTAAQAVRDLVRSLGQSIEVWVGPEGIRRAACLPEVDTVISAIVGAAGLAPTYAALQAGKRVCLANKESLVIGGPLIRQVLNQGRGEIIPVDSEHSALFQVMVGESREHIARLWLTASGGPFLHRPLHTFDRITVQEALQHPRWKMGPKITVDSATLMNKGLELVEAHYLFDWPVSRIEVVIHPQSIVHSMVEFVDGSFKAQLSLPDMRLPILYALTYPHRLPLSFPTWRPDSGSILEFLTPERERFPCLWLARSAIEAGPSYPIVLNAANEIAVQAFLAGRIRFSHIPDVIHTTLEAHESQPIQTLEDVWSIDRSARAIAERRVQTLEGRKGT